MNRKYNLNENYFERIKTPEQAYILGFIYADGYNNNESLVITQSASRIDILEKIKICLNSESEIGLQSNGLYIITFGSKLLCEDLTRYGATKAKSLTITFPNFLEEELIPHFIRGYFDGDGCVWDGKRKLMTVKDKNQLCGSREKIVHNVKFTITGNFEFINKLQDHLVSNLGFNKTKLNFSKAKTTKHICTMEYSGRKQMKKLFDYIYKDTKIYCEEKYQKFNNIFCAIEEKSSIETGLIAGKPEMVISSQADFSEGSSTIPEMEVESSDSKCPALNK